MISTFTSSLIRSRKSFLKLQQFQFQSIKWLRAVCAITTMKVSLYTLTIRIIFIKFLIQFFYTQLLVLLAIFAAILCSMVQTGRVVFEGEERRNHRRRKRPCRGRSLEEERTLLHLYNVNNNNYYICGGQVPTNVGPHNTLADNPQNGGHFQGGHFQGGLLGGGHSPGGQGNGGLLQGGLLQSHFQQGNAPTSSNDAQTGANSGNNLNRPAFLGDEYDRPGNAITNVAEGVQNTVLGVTNAVTGTIQEVVRPSNGLFFGLFDGSLISSFFNQRPPTAEPVKPVSEDYDEVEPDPNQNYHQNYKPGLNVIGNNPLTGQYTVMATSLKPSNLLKQFNKGFDAIVNPFLELLY